MPVVLKAIDLDDIFDEEMVCGWIGDSVQNGRPLVGYSKNIYMHKEYGEAEIYSNIVINEEEKNLEVEGFDIQVSGSCVWKVHYSDVALEEQTVDNMTRMALVKNTESGGFTIMHIINADILPSFLENDVIEVQVCAYAEDVNYYKDETAYAETIPVCEGMKLDGLNGHKLMPAMGSVLPNGFLNAHRYCEDGDCEVDSSNDELVLITGVVKGVYVKPVKLDDKEISNFIVTRVETQFGDLDVIHSRKMISDEEAEILKKGAVIQAVAIISGDPAINEYENGMVKNEKNNLAALRYAMMKGCAKRLASILSDDIEYESINLKNNIYGIENVISYLDYVHDNAKMEYYSYYATLENEYEGERCIVIAEGDEDNLTAIIRILIEDGMIRKIIVTDDPCLKFRIDEPVNYKTPNWCNH